MNNISSEIVFKDIPYSLEYLKNANENIEWDVFCKITKNLRSIWNDDDYIKLGKEIIRNPVLNVLSAISGIFLSVKAVYRLANEPITGIGHQFFRCITPNFKEISKNHIEVSLTLPPNYNTCEEFFLITKGFFISVPLLVKQLEAEVLMHETDQGAIYDIQFKERVGVLSWLKKIFTLPFSVKANMQELSEAYELLHNRYTELELSRTKIQKQAKQKEIALSISHLIRSKLDLYLTLSTIVNALNTVPWFEAIEVTIDTTLDNEPVKYNWEFGTKSPDSSPIIRLLEGHGQKIGEIVFWTQANSNAEEIQELLDYIIPTISMEILNALSFNILDNYRNNLELKIDERTNELKNTNEKLAITVERLKELQAARDRFFSGVSHEFRTPLTLILGPVDKLINESADELVKKQANAIKENAIRLLGLINQLLELSKLEAGKVKLDARMSNIVSFIKGIALSFESLAELKKINIKINSEKENIPLYFDKDMMMKILSNLISNSLKFTNEGGEVIVTISEMKPYGRSEITEIKVWDNGIGIPEEDLPRLFDRYFQIDPSYSAHQQGTGIGLALTKELVELHHGTISVESKIWNSELGIRGWTEFSLTFLTGKEHINQNEILDKVVSTSEISEDLTKMHEHLKFFKADLSYHQENRNDLELLSDGLSDLSDMDKLLVLIVEDNHNVREFIKDCLGSEFQIELAANGKEALLKAVRLIPDLIISDIMMPIMSGYELTRILKQDERTSHIPIILLTAKSQQESKLEGLEAGADVYLTKPFDAKELLIRIYNLINIQKKLQDKFRKDDFIFLKRKQGKKLSNLDEQFMNKVLEVIENHLGEEDFTIEQFGSDAGLSRVQLHRKLKALTGKSASSYLRSVRLLKAKKMLEEKEGNISEIAYSTGFSSPTYFTRCFKEEFGYLPSNLKN